MTPQRKKISFMDRHPGVIHGTLAAVGVAIALAANMAYSTNRVERLLIDRNHDGEISWIESEMYHRNTTPAPTNSYPRQ